jgi:hypothetical protein
MLEFGGIAVGYWTLDLSESHTFDAQSQLGAIALRLTSLRDHVEFDPVLGSAFGPNGLQVPNAAISSVSGSKVLGAVAEATTVPDDAITQAKIADDSVGAPQLIDDSVGPDALADLAVGTPALAAGAVTDAKVTDVAFGKLTGDYALANRNTGFYGGTPVARPAVPAFTNNLTAPGTIDTQPNFAVTGVVADDIDALYDAAQRQAALTARLINAVVRATGLGG